MAWAIKWTDKAVREFRKLDHQAQKNIQKYLREKIAAEADPRRFGKPLMGDLMGLWRYRVGDHRIICHLKHDQMVVMVLSTGHRKNIYQ